MKKKKVLVVDDEIYICNLIKKALEKEYDIILANNGEDALKIIHGERPDMVLMDILMPKLDGYTACHQIKNDPVIKKTPVIMLTCIGYELNKKLAEEIGAGGYITKPFATGDLLDIVKRYEATLCTICT